MEILALSISNATYCLTIYVMALTPAGFTWLIAFTMVSTCCSRIGLSYPLIPAILN